MLSLLSAFDHPPRCRRNFFAGKLQAKSKNVCGETFAVGVRWGSGTKRVGIAPHGQRMKQLDSKSLHCDGQGECYMV